MAIAVVFVSLILMGFIAFLLIKNYLSQVELQKSATENFKTATEKQATALSYFFNERKNDIKNIVSSREIAIFFENKALGMSMEYGLQQSLLSITNLFNYLFEEKKLNAERIYNRIVFVDENGKLISSCSHSIKERRMPEPQWKKFITPKRYDVFLNVRQQAEQLEIIISSPYFFKNKYVGQIIAWLEPRVIYNHLLNGNDKSTNRNMFFNCGTGSLFPQEKAKNIFSSIEVDKLKNIPSNEPYWFQMINRKNSRIKMLALRLPIQNTPLSIITTLPVVQLFGNTNPRDLLLAMAVIALIILCAMAFVLTFHTQNLVLNAYLSQEHKRKKEVEEKNVLLEQEISERKRIEQALRENEEMFRKISSSAQNAIIIMNNDGNISYWNKAAEKILGYTSEKALGQNLHTLIAPKTFMDGYSKGLSHFENTGQGPIVGKTVEFTAIRKNGEEIPIELALSAVRLKGRWNAIGILRDISQRKQIESSLREAKEFADAANRAKSEFLSNMSHELRTPLNHIIGFTELVVDRQFGALNKVQHEYLNDVLQSSKHLLSLINDILDLSRIEAGKLQLEVSSVSLKILLENSITIIKQKAMKHEIKVSMDIHEIPDFIKADERKLKQIMYNLLSNAVKFTPNKGSVYIKAYPVKYSELPILKINQRLTENIEEATKKFIKISVADTGIGLKKNDLDLIFKPFEQIDSAANRKYQGSGLGLSLTKKFVELHGGRIWAESQGENKGTTFHFVIPFYS